MRGNVSERRRQNHGAAHTRVAEFFHVCGRLAGALLAAVALAASDTASARTSCPLTTTVPPFAESAGDRYEIVTTDGGGADLDAVADGACRVVVRVCRREASLCSGYALRDVTARAVGRRAGREQLALVQRSVREALVSLLDPATPCELVRITLAADDKIALRFRTVAESEEGRSVLRRSRLGLHCIAAGAAESGDARCTSGRGACPPPAPAVCGNGLRDAQAERCDGADDLRCPGACRPDCSCGVTSGDLDVAPEAVVTASSSATNSQPEFAVDRIVDGWPYQPEHEWTSSGEHQGAWLRLSWPHPVNVDTVILYDRPNPGDDVTDGVLFVDDEGEAIATGPLAPDGAPTYVPIGRRTVRALTFAVRGATGTSAGLAEIQAVRRRGRPKKDPTTTTTTTTTTTSTSTSTTTTSTSPSTTSSTSTSTATSTSRPTTTSTSTSTSTSTTSSTSTTAPPPNGPAYYISPTGSDANAGTSAAAPWKTFAKAVKALYPGDTLIVADGKYTRGTTGMPVIDCANGVRNGTADKPITIRAANPRRAWLANNGIGEAVYMNECNYWNIVGVHASSADNTGAKAWEGNVMRVYRSGNVRLQGVLAVRPNRTCPSDSLTYCNVHGIAIEKSHHVLVEDCEVYDFHRHGVSAFNSRYVTVRRCYMNPWDATGGAGGGSTGVILYGSSDSIVENVIGEGVYGLNIAGGTVYDGTPGGYRNKLLGVVTLDAKHGSTIRARKFSGPVLPLGDNLVKDSVFIRAQNVGVFARGANDTVVENVSVFDTHADAGIAADEDLSEGAPCSANPKGCSITTRSVLSVGNAGKGMTVKTSVMKFWALQDSNLYDNAGGNFPTSETPGDESGSIRRSRSVAPSGMGTGTGKCMLWVPDASNMKGAGAGGSDIGATVLRRYRNGVLTSERLWDPTTGAFPCGPTVAGVNDNAARTCIGVHRRLNVNTNGCAFPAGY
jgi:hypothetical protein